MKKICRVLALVLVFAGVFQVMPVSANANVSKDEKINTLKERGIVKGYPDGSLGLDKNIKRSEIASLLVNLSGNAEMAKTAGSDVFSDVKKTHWAYGVIDVASKLENQKGNKLINGYPDGTFKPDNEITNAEIIKILVSLKKTDLTEKDIADAIWPNSWVLWGSDANIIGKSAGVTNLNVRDAAKRGDVFAMIYNTIYDENKNPITNQFKLGGNAVVNSVNTSAQNKSVTNEVKKEDGKLDLASEVNGFNDGSKFNHSAFENKFIELVNADRAKLGLHAVKLGGDLERGTLQRSKELAENGNIRVNGKSHVRLDGSSFDTVLDYLQPRIEYTAKGENLLSIPENVYANASRDNLNIAKSPGKLAEECYQIWWNSPNHRDNMMNKDFDYISVKIQTALKDGDPKGLYTVATTLFRSEYDGNSNTSNGNVSLFE
ncbi:S-layer homology domain-containing protein [Peptoniphilus sp. MSJ-1]|uniref:S-layer homology domain-containing protein n=1 Tax=Peptoniphilus ovalis TaxID=2841503 RepID=A0ABS6FHH3_9FIRM|nr:S-layer homology domain-containing protein [Peptoniphilus ovalis]MBU5668701.1 S-layer homology domain-containing protein [Peptoniphilus ovalis]